MNPDGLNKFMQEYPEVVLAIIQMLMQMDKEQLTQLVQTLQQMVESKGQQAQGGEGQAPTQEQAEMQGANQSLYGQQ